MSFENHTGKFYGTLYVILDLGMENKKHWCLCQCYCGVLVIYNARNLIRGEATGCGCWRHGMKGTQLYNTWRGMIDRCTRKNRKDAHIYNARNITVYPPWRHFSNFCEWAFQKGYGEGLEIDRIDNEGGYSPENCRWVTRKQQCRNKRDNILILYNSEEMTLGRLSELINVSEYTLYARYRAGDRGKRLIRPLWGRT